MPLTERIWRHLKERPDQSSAQIVSVFKSSNSEGSIKRTIYDMVQRKMLVMALVESGRGRRKGRPFGLFRVSPELRDYEMLPGGRKVAHKTKAATPVQESRPVVVAPQEAESQPAANLPLDLESLSIREARELYQRLHKFFGGR